MGPNILLQWCKYLTDGSNDLTMLLSIYCTGEHKHLTGEHKNLAGGHRILRLMMQPMA